MYFSSSIQCYSGPRRIDSLMHCREDYGFSMDMVILVLLSLIM